MVTARQRMLAYTFGAVLALAGRQALAGDMIRAEPDSQALVARARSLVEIGDFAAARLFLKRASEMGDKQAAAQLSALLDHNNGSRAPAGAVPKSASSAGGNGPTGTKAVASRRITPPKRPAQSPQIVSSQQ